MEVRHTFDNIAGYKEEKKVLMNYSSLIERAHELKSLGGKLPKGLMLIRPNGTGKTILAEAFINASGCNVVEINSNDVNSDGDFGDYAKEKFLKASKLTSSILYIDEFDKLVGNKPNFFLESDADRSRIFLIEMNKYNDVDGLFILVIANEQYAIEESLIQAGRLNGCLEINLPNEGERKEIIEYYLSNKKYERSLDIENLAVLTNGFSGADIEALINDALINAFVEQRKEIFQKDISNIYYDRVFKNVNKDEKKTDEALKLVSIHEAGHAAVNLLLDSKTIDLASILTRNDVQGFVSSVKSSQEASTNTEVIKQVKISLGGKVAEEINGGDLLIGSSSDLKNCVGLINKLVRENGYLGLDYLQPKMCMSDIFSVRLRETSRRRTYEIELEENKLLKKLYNETKELLENNFELATLISEELVKHKVLNKAELLEIDEKYKSLIRE